MDWLATHTWASWMAAAVLLACAEMLTLDFTLLMLASGALAAGLVALALPAMWPVHLAVFAVTSVAMLGLLRPTLLRKVRTAPGYLGSAENVVGGSGVALREITGRAGEIRLSGETWSARSASAEPIEQGTEVEVERMDGVTLYVRPAHRTKQ